MPCNVGVAQFPFAFDKWKPVSLKSWKPQQTQDREWETTASRNQALQRGILRPLQTQNAGGCLPWRNASLTFIKTWFRGETSRGLPRYTARDEPIASEIREVLYLLSRSWLGVIRNTFESSQYLLKAQKLTSLLSPLFMPLACQVLIRVPELGVTLDTWLIWWPRSSWPTRKWDVFRPRRTGQSTNSLPTRTESQDLCK